MQATAVSQCSVAEGSQLKHVLYDIWHCPIDCDVPVDVKVWNHHRGQDLISVTLSCKVPIDDDELRAAVE